MMISVIIVIEKRAKRTKRDEDSPSENLLRIVDA